MIKIVDNSEYCILICILLCISGLIWGLIDTEYFFSVVLGFSFVVLLISIYKIRTYGIAYGLMETSKKLEEENKKLGDSVLDLEKQNENLGSRVRDMGRLMGIFDRNNKTAEEIQDEMLETLCKLEDSNRKYESLNKTHAFMIADRDADGVLSKQEQETLKLISSDSVIDANGDNVIDRKDYLTFAK